MAIHYTTKEDRPLLTLAQVREWQARHTEIGREMQTLQAEQGFLARKLEAAKILMGDIPALSEGTADGPNEPHSSENVAGTSLADAALQAVEALGNLPRPEAIKAWISERYPDLAEKLKSSPNYFYTVLIRHVQKGRLVREGTGYRLAASSPQGETGAVAAPALI